MRYNLLEEPWIPVLGHDGKVRRVGIREVLTQAGRIRQIAASNPMDRVAILRFLLAILYWCRGNPPDESEDAPSDPFPAEWFSKLDANRDCFNLLGDGKRFYQDPAAKRERPSTDLIQEIPTGNNFWHFRHSTDKANGLCAACCAMGLLRLPLFSVSGLPDLKSGINGTPPVYVVPCGKTLLATLCANWKTHALFGRPAWIQPDIRPAPNQDVPLLTGLTLVSRRVWLHAPSAPPGRCGGCGAREEALIRTCGFETAGRQENDLWDDPHVVYLDRSPRRAARTSDLTAAERFRMDRPWPDLLARILETGKFAHGDEALTLFVVGFATSKAKNIDVWERTMSIPSTESTPATAASLLRQWHKEGPALVRRLKRRNKNATSRKHSEIDPLIAAVRPHVEHRVSAQADKLLAGGDDAWEQAAREYRPLMDAVARSLSPGFTTAALRWREEIARAMPDMRVKTESVKKPGRKKGGDM